LSNLIFVVVGRGQVQLGLAAHLVDPPDGTLQLGAVAILGAGKNVYSIAIRFYGNKK
jgi:hypothetical protein